MGGCLAAAIFHAPLLWSRRALVVGVLGIGLAVGLLAGARCVGDFVLPADSGARFLIVVQFAVFVAAGISLLALAATDLWHSRNAASALLVLWVAETFVFCWLVNWTVNGRTILPMAPAASILIIRRIDRFAKPAAARSSPWRLNAYCAARFLPLVLTAIVAVAVTWSDVCWADTERAAAATMNERYGGRKDTVLFAGNSGFQYYMESYGFKAIDAARTRLLPGDALVLPSLNVNVPSIPAEVISDRKTFQFALFPYLSTSRPEVGAYFCEFAPWGLLPFGVGAFGPDRYDVVTLRTEYELSPLIRQRQDKVAQHPDSAEALGNLGNILVLADRASEGRKYLERAARLGSRNPLVYLNLGRLLATSPAARQRNGAQAIEYAQRARELLDETPAVLDTLAAAYAEAGRFAEAVAAARKAMELAMAGNDRRSADAVRSRIALYEAGKPYHEASPASGLPPPTP
jgi:tetratricopeptide (TPR) repeat protein